MLGNKLDFLYKYLFGKGSNLTRRKNAPLKVATTDVTKYWLMADYKF